MKNEFIMKPEKILIFLLITTQLTGCLNKRIKLPLPKLLRPPITAINKPVLNNIVKEGDKQNKAQERFTETPHTHVNSNTVDFKKKNKVLLQGEKSQVNVENLAIPDFINEIFGNLLGLSFKLAPGLDKQKDLVTLRFTESQTPEVIYQAAIVILGDYGVQTLKTDDLLRFSYSNKTPVGEPPLFVSGRTLPNVPVSHRPVFQMITLHSVRNTDVRGWLNQLYKGHGLTVSEDPKRNALILQGSQEIIAQAVQAIEVLDQPSMRSRYSIKIAPLYQPASTLADGLLKVLKAEGYAASKNTDLGSIMVMPIEASNAVFIFSANKAVLDHIKQWAVSIDQPALSGDEKGLFYYEVQNVAAKGIVDSLGSLTSSIVTNVKNEQSKLHAKQQNSSNTRLQVDESRNSIFFYGKSGAWTNLLPIIKKMDIPARQVLIEVTVAEITLTDEESFGVEWIFEQASGELSSVLRTLGGLGVAASSGLSYVISSAGNTRVVLNALATTKNVNILSTPRILVKSGEEASIEIGTEIPIVTSQASAADLANSGDQSSILQNIQYRKTGTLLNVKPVVYAGRRVDIDLTQEISAAQENKTSGLDSPTILNRKVDTHLTLQDGHSILLAGLINTDISQDHRGIPFLKDIPYLGLLFSHYAETKVRTEIIILITPYVIDNSSEIADITRNIIEQSQFNPIIGVPIEKNQRMKNISK